MWTGSVLNVQYAKASKQFGKKNNNMLILHEREKIPSKFSTLEITGCRAISFRLHYSERASVLQVCVCVQEPPHITSAPFVCVYKTHMRVLDCWYMYACVCLSANVCAYVCAGMNARAERTGAKDKTAPPPHTHTLHHSSPLHFHMAPASLAWTVATGVASDHLGGYWTATAAFCNNLARFKFIRVEFGPGCSAVVLRAFGPRCPVPHSARTAERFLLDPGRAISGCLWWWLCSPVSHADTFLWMIWAITLFTQAMQ